MVGAEASRALLHMKEATGKNKQEKKLTEPSVISTSSHQNVIETNRCMVFEWETRKMVDFTIECIAHNQLSCHQMKLQRIAEKWTFSKEKINISLTDMILNICNDQFQRFSNKMDNKGLILQPRKLVLKRKLHINQYFTGILTVIFKPNHDFFVLFVIKWFRFRARTLRGRRRPRLGPGAAPTRQHSQKTRTHAVCGP